MPKNVQSTAQLHSSHTLVILKILQARLQQYMNHEIPDVQAGFRKGKGTRDQMANILWIIEKAREYQKNICFIDFDLSLWLCGSQQTVEYSSRDGITRPPDLLLRNLYAGQEGTVKTGHITTDWFQIGKGMCQIYILSSCLFNLYTEYLMRNTGLDEAHAGIKIAGRNINNLRYADDTTLMEESKKNWRASWWKWRRVKKLV